jgi:hypothetical protein
MMRLFSGKLITGVVDNFFSLPSFVSTFVLVPVAVLVFVLVPVVVCVNRRDDDDDIVDLVEDIFFQNSVLMAKRTNAMNTIYNDRKLSHRIQISNSALLPKFDELNKEWRKLNLFDQLKYIC